MLKWLCSRGCVAAGINYTLRSEEHPEANVYTQSVKIRDSIPAVIAQAERLGYRLDRMAVSSGSYLEAVKDISAAMWVNENSVPSISAYGAWGRVQAFSASKRLDTALTEHSVPHEYIVFRHSGHGLQNDNRQYKRYMEKVVEYLGKYMG